MAPLLANHPAAAHAHHLLPVGGGSDRRLPRLCRGVRHTQGGPLQATFFYMLYLFQVGFQDFHMGYASAMAWILILITTLVGVITFKTSNRWVYYEAADEPGR
jgi:hypothetical protein